MSRIGKSPVNLPAGVEVSVVDRTITVKGPKGTLSRSIPGAIEVSVEGDVLTCTRPNDERFHRAQHGLECITEDGRLGAPARRCLTLAEQQARAEVDLLGDLGQGRRVDHALAQIGELSLREIAVLTVGEVGDHPTQHGIAEELESLVARLAPDLAAPAAMRHGAAQQRHVGELVAQSLLEPGQIGMCRCGDLRRP